MPSFAFWKSNKPDPSKAPLLTEDAAAQDSSMVIPLVAKNLDLNPDGEDSGVFLFDDDAMPLEPEQVLEAVPLIATPPAGEREPLMQEPEREIQVPVKNYSKKLILDDTEEAPAPPPKSSPLSQPQGTAATEKLVSLAKEETAAVQHVQEAVPQQESPAPSPSTHGQDNALKRPISTATASATQSRDRDSGVYVSDDDSLPPQSRPTSLALNDSHHQSRNSSISLKHTVSTSTTSPRQRTDSIARLKRPAELNLGTNPVSDSSKPRSELEKRYDLIRNSKTQSKAALRSPTALLQERLNMSAKKERVEEEKTRVFTPPRQTTNGCWLPGPGAHVGAFTSTSVRARTEAGNRPAWWCKVDKLVVFDGIDAGSDGDMKIHTRSSKGLSIARRRGDMETIVIPMDCAHCQEMLNRHEWKYDMRVCKRSVCWDCKERCKWELKQEKLALEGTTARLDGNRYRADSLLQDERHDEEHMMQKVGIEQDRPMSPIEALGGIEERLSA
ncbi:uncharacterized protein J4E78_005796 [Alternaria triticimaculans]|uniref:uncharacterized protein n=1 Tax=Alternaria triticimaculans TaxID=297637 RepID=UPI0020C268A9|nr:uncharacterized protein J4E78_005796 [Alternaria triticimaculans]KAI4659369.1 hypothetical protein J4E78_005796 [Alternaria triticimaculans]